MELAHRDGHRCSVAESFVALDIDGETESSERNAELLVESFSRRGLEREKGGEERKQVDGDTNSFASTGMHEKQATSVHVACDANPKELLHATTPTAGGRRRRGGGRRVPPWRDPRKILFGFAALSSVGTLILLYFTLSMGKMTGAEPDGR